jgi:hypothetical protein
LSCIYSVEYPWHLKSNQGVIIKFKWLGLQIVRINRKRFGWCGITSSCFPALMNMVIFGHFSQFRAKRWKRQQSCFFLFWRFYDVVTKCKKWLLFIKLSIWKYFSKILLRSFHQFQGLSLSYSRPGHFGAIPSICNQRFLI